MALKQRNTTRLAARVGTWIAVAVSFLIEVLKSFLNIKKGDGFLKKGKKTIDLIIRRALYFVADYGLTVVSVSIFTAMKALEFPFLWTFVSLWAFDFVVAGAFIVVFEKTGKDLSLGVDFRRATDTINGRSRLAGFVTTVWIIFLSIVWTGPEKIITFFRKEIGTIHRLVMVLIALTVIQSFIWTILYGVGYSLVTKLF